MANEIAWSEADDPSTFDTREFWICTNQLRWRAVYVTESHSNYQTAKMETRLQQAWQSDRTGLVEWRDIPTVGEDA